MDKVKTVINLVGIGLHVADLFTDIATTKLYWENCQYTFFLISTGIFIFSYISTVIYLVYTAHKKENLKTACLYPYHVMRIMIKKFMISLNSRYQST